MVAVAAISASNGGLDGGPFADKSGGSGGLLLLFNPLSLFLGHLDLFLCNKRGDGDHENDSWSKH